MIQKLRIRFVLAAMLSLTLVLALLLTGVNLLSYHRMVSESDQLLQMLAENEGRFPEHRDFDENRRHDIRRGILKMERRNQSPEMPFEARFFSVTLDAQGTALERDTERIAAVDAETAEACAHAVAARGRDRGFWANYRYMVQQTDNGTRYLFLDCQQNLSMFLSTLLGGLSAGAAVLILVLLILIPVSGQVVRPIAESYDKQRRFITDAGHEIKTPLTIISADTDLAELDCGENEWLTDIRRQAQRLTELTGELITLSRMDEEIPALQAIEFPISDVAEEAAAAFLPLAKQQGRQLQLEITPMLSFTGCEKDIRQLVSILTDNALKYSPAGGQVTVRLEKTGRNMRLTVENPIVQPMTKEQLSRMFDRFARLEDSRNSATGGFGLGLAIASGIVTAHKGKIKADTVGENTLRITVTL